MPTYEFTETDGSVYEIDGPEGATAEQIAAAVKNSLAIEKGRQEEEEARRAYEAYLTAPIAARPEEIEEEGLFSTNVGRGVDLLQQMYGSALEGAGKVTGLEGLRDYGTEIEQANRRELEATAGAARSTSPKGSN